MLNRGRFLTTFIIVLMLVSNMAGLAFGVPITYVFEGKAKGFLDNKKINNDFSITLSTDTEEVLPMDGFNTVSILEPAILNIDKIGTGAMMLDDIFMYNVQPEYLLAISSYSIGGDILSINDSAFEDYDLTTELQLDNKLEGSVPVFEFTSITTELGELIFESVTKVSFSAFSSPASATKGMEEIILDYDTNPVPEPGTILLLGFGLVGLTGAGHKKIFKKS